MKNLDRFWELLPVEARAFWEIGKTMRAQGSLEYIMMIAAASVVVVIALAMIVKLKGAIINHVSISGVNTSVSDAISKELSNLSSNLS
jgi:hypothetical protein